MRLLASMYEFEEYLSAAKVYWSTNVIPPGDTQDWIVTEALHQDIRVTLRNLTVANGLRRLFPARVLVVTGTDQDWMDALFKSFDTSPVRALCEAFGAEMVDVHDLVDGRLSPGGGGRQFVVNGKELPAAPADVRIDDASFAACLDATSCRLLRVPRLTEELRGSETHLRTVARSRAFADLYADLFSALPVQAFITSHVDYNQWGLAVDAAIRHDVPVLHTQSTGSMKAYALFPDRRRGMPGLRSELTHQIADFFEEHVWGNRDVLHRSAELVAWRSKANFGRPSWWRGGATASATLVSTGERDQVRRHAMERFGFDPAKPVVVVFNHAVSDALGTNHESFPDLAGWFEQTAAYAARDTAANWLFVDHPSQGLYDVTGFFSGLAATHKTAHHLVFKPSVEVAKNVLWSLCDLGVTVRGSVSNELPAYGIPVIQAGWSEWSHCGLSLRADDEQSYRELLTSSIAALARGEELITAEMVERARLWLWFYRAGADVVSELVPTWDEGDRNPLLRGMRIFMRNVESDGDPAHLAVARMWDRRDPFLTRIDLTSPDAVRAAMPRIPVPTTALEDHCG